MLQIQLERNLEKQCLRVGGSPDRDERPGKRIGFREQMILHNNIEGILKFEINQVDDIKYCEYPIAGLETLSERCASVKLGYDMLVKLLRELFECVFKGREYMLSQDDFLIGPDTVFVDKDGSPQAVYYDGYAHDLRSQLCCLAEYLMDKVDYKDDSAVLLVYTFYMKAKEECTLEDLLKVINARQERTKERRVSEIQEKQEAQRMPDGEPSMKEPVSDAGQRQGNRVIDREALEIRETPEYERIGTMEIIRLCPKYLPALTAVIILAGIALAILLCHSRFVVNELTEKPGSLKSAAVILGISSACAYGIMRLWKKRFTNTKERLSQNRARKEPATVLLTESGIETGLFSLVSDIYPTITASRFPFFIGTDREKVDYVLAHSGVSRYHLKINRSGEDYTISDLNSTNGTYLNGEKLAPHVPYKIRRGDEIRLAKSIFYMN